MSTLAMTEKACVAGFGNSISHPVSVMLRKQVAGNHKDHTKAFRQRSRHVKVQDVIGELQTLHTHSNENQVHYKQLRSQTDHRPLGIEALQCCLGDQVAGLCGLMINQRRIHATNRGEVLGLIISTSLIGRLCLAKGVAQAWKMASQQAALFKRVTDHRRNVKRLIALCHSAAPQLVKPVGHRLGGYAEVKRHEVSRLPIFVQPLYLRGGHQQVCGKLVSKNLRWISARCRSSIPQVHIIVGLGRVAILLALDVVAQFMRAGKTLTRLAVARSEHDDGVLSRFFDQCARHFLLETSLKHLDAKLSSNPCRINGKAAITPHFGEYTFSSLMWHDSPHWFSSIILFVIRGSAKRRLQVRDHIVQEHIVNVNEAISLDTNTFLCVPNTLAHLDQLDRLSLTHCYAKGLAMLLELYSDLQNSDPMNMPVSLPADDARVAGFGLLYRLLDEISEQVHVLGHVEVQQ